jgi:hypothetical protein
MDGPVAALQAKLDQLLQEAARVAVALDRANGTIVGISHPDSGPRKSKADVHPAFG